MKKFLVVFLALSLVGGAAFAQDFNLTAGLEAGLLSLDFDNLDDAMDTFYLRPSISFEIDSLLGGLELFAEAAVPLGFNDYGDNFWAGLDLTFNATYNLGITADGTLSFILESQTFVPVTDYAAWVGISPMFWGFDFEPESYLTTGIRYTHELPVMSIFGQVDVPFLLFSGYEGIDPFDWVGLDFTLGLNMDMGFGIEVFIENSLRGSMFGSGETSFFDWLTITPYFENGPLYAEVAVVIPTMDDGMDFFGVSFIPEVRFQIIDALQAYLFVSINHVFSNWFDTQLYGIGTGVRFSFF